MKLESVSVPKHVTPFYSMEHLLMLPPYYKFKRCHYTSSRSRVEFPMAVRGFWAHHARQPYRRVLSHMDVLHYNHI